MAPLTEKSFFAFAKCPKWVQYEAVDGKMLGALEWLLLDDSVLPELRVSLLKARGEYQTVEDEDVDDAMTRTLDMMHKGVPTIYGATLVNDGWVGKPDVLERVEGKSSLGSYYYVAIDIKRLHKVEHIRDTHKMQGVLYALLLQKVQGVKPVSGYILTPDSHVLRYSIEDIEADTVLTMQTMKQVRDGEEGGAQHMLTSGCKASPYAKSCLDEAESTNDIALLNRVNYQEVIALRRAGIQKVSDLAMAHLPTLNGRIIDIAEDRLSFMQKQAIALCERRHILVEPFPFPVADTELYFDIEADPLRDADYLFGVWRVTGALGENPQGTYHSFFAHTPREEEQVFQEFITFLEQEKGSPVYHYGWYEIEVMSRLFERYGCPEGLHDVWRNSFVDINASLRGRMILPLYFYSLKDIAKYIGFTWRGKDVGGIQSIHWYHEWLRTGDRTWKERICEYNEDDVRATWEVKKWLIKESMVYEK